MRIVFALLLCGTLLTLLAIVTRDSVIESETAVRNRLFLYQLNRQVFALEAALRDVRRHDQMEMTSSEGIQDVPERESSFKSVAGPRGEESTARDPAAQTRLSSARAVTIDALRLSQLVRNGFAEDRAQWIIRKMKSWHLRLSEEQFDRKRAGKATVTVTMNAVHRKMREELGHEEYKRYRLAMSLSVEVNVTEVPRGTLGERAGVVPGDTIIAYDGHHIFDSAELGELASQGVPGESVVIEVMRNGIRVPLVAERGPLGLPVTSIGFSDGADWARRQD